MLLMKKWMQKLYDTKIYKKYHQFFRFCLVGGTNFLISLIVYNLVLWIFGCFPDGEQSSNFLVSFLFRYDYQIANIIAFVISVLNAYILNRFWVFKLEAKKTNRGAIFRFFASYGLTFSLTIFLAWFWVETLNIPKGLVPFLNVLVTTPINFSLSKYFAFRDYKKHIPGVELLPYDEKEDEKEVEK